MKKLLLALALLTAATTANATFMCQGDTSDDPPVHVVGRWYVGNGAFVFYDNDGFINYPDAWVMCWAFDTELDYIRQKFSGIPMRSGALNKPIIWKGDTATFLIDNISSR